MNMAKDDIKEKPVLMSIRPRWLNRILRGEKTVEVRKTFPQTTYLPFRVLLYETTGPTDVPWMDEDGHAIWKGQGMIIGECMCDDIYDIKRTESGHERKYDEAMDSLSNAELSEYLGECAGYGWHLTDVKVYETPVSIKKYGLNRPPQSWRYIEA